MPKQTALVLAVLLYALSAWFSVGYHHPDEHFQVLELAHYKLGRSAAADLPWEFEAQIRPGLQPALAATIIRGAEFFGWHNPFTQAFLMRLMSGWLCLCLYFSWAQWLEKKEGPAFPVKWLRWSFVLLWFLPYLSVRFSSENMAGLSFGAGILLLLQGLEPNVRQQALRCALAGFLLGLSFFFRFQMGFALLGAAAWILVELYRQRNYKPLGYLLAGLAPALLLGVAADSWLYDAPVFPAYNYFVSNIIENKAANWGVAPWWFYITQAFQTAVPPVSILLLLFLVLGSWFQRKNVLFWSLLPFLLAHFVVGHKEMRFMYPMLLPVLLLSVQGMWEAQRLLQPYATARRWYHRFFLFTLIVNCLLLPVRSILAAQESVACFQFLYRYAEKQPVQVFSHKKLLYEIVGLNMNFYRSPNIQNTMYVDIKAKTVPAGALILSQDLQLKNPPPNTRTERIYAYFPDWILNVDLNNWQSRTRMWSIHQVL